MALSRAGDNKGKRDQRHNITPVAGLLAELYSVRKPNDPRVFPWNHTVRTLDREFHRIQRAAEIHLPCRGDYEHAPTCHVYGFHSFRYGFAQYNFEHLSREQLQEQMGHRSATTTDGCIDHAKRQGLAQIEVFVPNAIRKAVG